MYACFKHILEPKSGRERESEVEVERQREREG